MPRLRAKLWITKVTRESGYDTLSFDRVAGADIAENGDTTISATLELRVTNPTLLGAYAPGQQFYVDFTEANESRTT